MNNIGYAIRKVRKEVGLTQEQLAESANISRSHLAEIESGKYSPTMKTMEAIAKACKKPVKDFV